MTQQGDDVCLVTPAFRGGSEKALAEIYARWSPLVYSFALRSLEDVPEAEQVTQRVFTRAWTSRLTFDSTRARLSTWLMAITRTKVAEARAAQPRPAAVSAQSSRTDQVHSQTERGDLLQRLLLVDEMSCLDAIPQRVLRMALYDHLSHTQIASRTGLSPAAVRRHLRTSLLELRARLEVQPNAC